MNNHTNKLNVSNDERGRLIQRIIEKLETLPVLHLEFYADYDLVKLLEELESEAQLGHA